MTEQANPNWGREEAERAVQLQALLHDFLQRAPATDLDTERQLSGVPVSGGWCLDLLEIKRAAEPQPAAVDGSLLTGIVGLYLYPVDETSPPPNRNSWEEKMHLIVSPEGVYHEEHEGWLLAPKIASVTGHLRRVLGAVS